MLKRQPEHRPEDLARVVRVPVGAQSDIGLAALRGRRDPFGRLVISPRSPVLPGPRESRPRRRWT